MNQPPQRFRVDFRKFIFAALLLLFGAFVVHRFGQVEELLQTLRSGRIEWVLIALALQTATLINQPALYQALYQALSLPMRWRELAPVVWAGHFVNCVTPAAGLGGTALLYDQARRRNFDLGRVTLANTLYFLLNFLWFVMLLGFGLTMLFLWHDLKPYEIVVALVPMLGVLLALGALWLVATRPQAFTNLVLGANRIANSAARFVLKRDVLPAEKARDFATTFAESVNAVRTSRAHLGRAWIHAMLVDGLEIAVLWACFAAFPGAGHPVTLAMLITGYAIGTLFLVVSVTPQGLGVVEGVMTAVFVSLGVPLERAAIVVLAYRGLSFWLPLCVGFVALRWTPQLKK